MGPVLKFLKDTEFGDRPGARERELEWQQKSDQGENQLTDCTVKERLRFRAGIPKAQIDCGEETQNKQ